MLHSRTMKYVPLDKLVFALCLVATLAAKSGEDWGMKKRRSSDEDWGMKRARGSDEDWGMKRARGSDEDWGMKRARGSDEDWGMKRARGSDEDWGMKKKRSQCGKQGESCFSTEHCCKSFVCAVFDEHDMKPEVPGVCMHEKELTPCESDLACKTNERCSKLNPHAAERYCVSRASPRQSPSRLASQPSKSGAGGLGSACTDSDDCLAQTSSGEKLCCQKVALGRQGTKVICDRINPTSTCIAKRK